MSIEKILSIVAVLFFLGYFIFFLILHFKKTGYHPIRHAVSDYGVGATKNLFIIYAWLSNLGALSLSIVMLIVKDRFTISASIPVLIILMVISRIIMLFFPTDLEGEKLTVRGKLHFLFAILAFTFSYMAIDRGGSHLKLLEGFKNLEPFFHIITMISSISLGAVVVTMFKPLRFIFGICERVFLLSINIWFIVVSIWFVYLL
ncbi:DUF998 domain-containing protein [Bacillus paramycoides]|uniref:DUF998 domain-containing protein n=1 Tax=Bacillus paramycoides TaxID=2026194 RepID=A0ABU6N0K5_9BACI|nr:DUF998 domain-containing protein [Bacillus paramycoides]MED0981120.1 DUF998 domain-containing protein [Bacillus paramycoides]MED1567847.1 DUF998 domain-containing protein [Bacillus paramycoides]